MVRRACDRSRARPRGERRPCAHAASRRSHRRADPPGHCRRPHPARSPRMVRERARRHRSVVRSPDAEQDRVCLGAREVRRMVGILAGVASACSAQRIAPRRETPWPDAGFLHRSVASANLGAAARASVRAAELDREGEGEREREAAADADPTLVHRAAIRCRTRLDRVAAHGARPGDSLSRPGERRSDHRLRVA